MEPLIKQLTRQFYQWEIFGRGWQLYENPVDLEPPFVPFIGYEVQDHYIDDGKRPSLFSYIADAIKNTLQAVPVVENSKPQREAFPFEWNANLTALGILIPKNYIVSHNIMEHLMVMLSYASSQICLEIKGTHELIYIDLVCSENDREYIETHVKGYFPGVGIVERPAHLGSILCNDVAISIIELGLKEEFMRPLNFYKSFSPDPYIPLFNAFESLDKGEHISIQVMFRSTINAWSTSILASVLNNNGEPFFMDDADMVPLAKEKISSPLFAVSIRVFAQAAHEHRARYHSKNAGNALTHLSCSPFNSLMTLTHYPLIDEMLEDIIYRRTRRTGMLLNAKELVALVHIPDASINSSKLRGSIRKTKETPADLIGHAHVLGLNIHQGVNVPVSVPENMRLRHTHIIGATGTGKSTLLLNLILQDIYNGNGCVVLDPHGDLIESILPHIPENRYHDVIVIDPADTEYPVAFNMLQAHSEVEKEILSSDLVSVFKRLSTSWGDQMNSVFANAIIAHLEHPQGGSLTSVRRFLIEKGYRDSFLANVKDPSITYYWTKEFPLLKSSSIGPILTRLDTFLRPKLIRNMVSQPKGLDFQSILDGKRILLVKLSEGLIGKENSYLLGTMIVSKIHQAAMAQQLKDKSERSNFYLYIDEFQHFITPSMSSMLSGARKYGLGLILVHQNMEQLKREDTELPNAVMANAATRICFRMGDNDAKKFESGFSSFDMNDLQNLGLGEAIVRVEKAENDCSLDVIPIEEVDSETKKFRSQAIIELSRSKYATSRTEVEDFLQEASGLQPVFVNKEIMTDPVPTPLPSVVQTIQPFEIISAPSEKQLIKKINADVPGVKEVSQHRYLQQLIKKMAESRGYRAVIEELTPNGEGRVDVGLYRNNEKIAVEITVSTSHTWELHNVQKCLNAGYDKVVVCSTLQKSLDKISKNVKSEIPEHIDKIFLVAPEQFFNYLDDWSKDQTNETIVKGYRVKVEYQADSIESEKSKRESILKTIARKSK